LEKTNAIRMLERGKLPHTVLYYEGDGALNGAEVADLLGLPPEQMFKTLVTTGKSGGHYVFLIPVAEELDLKKAATAAGEKSVEMLKSKDLLPLTGYVHGGCSPLGMKKVFPTFVDESAEGLERMVFSAGKIGVQIEAAPEALAAAVRVRFADLAKG
jgi:ybaK/ebsC protein